MENSKAIYSPNFFRVQDVEVIHGFLQKNSFGTIITISNGNPVITRVPFLIKRDENTTKLTGHIAYANLVWKSLKELEEQNREVMITFDGPHTYISSSWYFVDDVPTWNYSTCIVKGIPKIIDDPQDKYNFLNEISSKYEKLTKSVNPDHQIWEISKLLREDVDNKLMKIKVFEVTVTNFECKFKMSQNRADNDQESVIEHLKLGTNQDKEVAEMMSTIRNKQ